MLKGFAIALALLFGGCSSDNSVRKRPTLHVSPYQTVTPKIGAGEPLLLELGSTSCAGCRDMSEKLALIRRQHPRSGIYFIDIKDERRVAQLYDVRMMPTQVILDGNGAVVYRHIGGMETGELLGVLQRYGVITPKKP